MSRRRPVEGELERRKKLETIIEQFDAEVANRVYQMRREKQCAISSMKSTLRMMQTRLTPAVMNSNWESLYSVMCCGGDSGGDMMPPPPLSSTAVAAHKQLEADKAAVAASAASRTRFKRGTTRKVGVTPSSLNSSCQVPFTPLPLPSASSSLVSSTPLVRAKFDPSTVLKQAPSTVRRHRPNELLMSLRGSPVVLDSGGKINTNDDDDDKKERKRCLELAARALEVQQSPEWDEAEKQTLLRLKEQLNSLPNLLQ